MTSPLFVTCPDCDGDQTVTVQRRGTIENGPEWTTETCETCAGSGHIDAPGTEYDTQAEDEKKHERD